MSTARKLEFPIEPVRKQRSPVKIGLATLGVVLAIMFGAACLDVVAGWYSSPQRAHMMKEVASGNRPHQWYHYFL